MALVKCKECFTEMSSTAKACPKCGAAPKKKTSVITWVFGGILAAAFVITIASNQNRSEQMAARTPEQVAAAVKKEAAFLAVVAYGKAIKSRMRDPDSLEWESIIANDDASVICMQYRAKNGFGGFGREIMVLAKGKTSSAAKAWNANCTGALTDFSLARLAI